MDYKNAKALFEQCLDGYDRNDDKVRLKIVHTYGVVKQSEEIAKRMRLSEEDTELARMIALLHDIGRFEQLKRFDSAGFGKNNDRRHRCFGKYCPGRHPGNVVLSY